jgi:hypothetical protein
MKERYEFTLSAKKEIMPTRRRLNPRCLWTGHSIPHFYTLPPFFIFFISMA